MLPDSDGKCCQADHSRVAADGQDLLPPDVRWPAICYDRLVYRIEIKLV